MPLTQSDRDKYKTLYIQTAKPYIKQIQESVTAFLGGVIDTEQLDIAHRAAHSLTSQSVMMEYVSLGQLTSLIEKTFKAKKDNLLELTPEVLTELRNSADKLQESVNAIEKDNRELDLTQDKERLSNIVNIPN